MRGNDVPKGKEERGRKDEERKSELGGRANTERNSFGTLILEAERHLIFDRNGAAAVCKG